MSIPRSSVEDSLRVTAADGGWLNSYRADGRGGLVANNDHLFLRMRFEGDRVVVEARDVSAGVMPDEAATFTGRLVRP